MYKHSRMTIPTSGTHLSGRDGGGRDVGGPCGGGGKAINQVSSTKFDTCWRLFTTDIVPYVELWRYYTAKCRERILVARKYINIMRERESPCLRANLPARARISFALAQNRTRALRYMLLSRRESART